MANPGKFRIAFLGGGPFGNSIRKALEKTFGLVSPEQAGVLVVASYGKILKPEEFDQPKHGTLVVHPSLLPKYRGATPVQATIMRGDSETGVTIIRMDRQVDHGPIIAQQTFAVSPNDRYATLLGKLAEIGGKLIVKTLPKYLSEEIKPIEQDHSTASFTKKITKEDGLLDLKKTVQALERQVRAYWPWPGSFIWLTDQNGRQKRLIIHQAKINRAKLVPLIVQLEGKSPVGWKEFKHGWRGELPML